MLPLLAAVRPEAISALEDPTSPTNMLAPLRPQPPAWRGAHPADLYDLLCHTPAEIRCDIYARAGALTQYLHGELDLPLNRATYQALIADAFRLDVVDFVRAEPFGLHLSWETMFVHSPEMAAAVEHLRKKYDVFYSAGHIADPVSAPVAIARFRAFVDRCPRELVSTASNLLEWVWTRVARPITVETAQTLLECAAGLGRGDLVAALLASHQHLDLVPALDLAAKLRSYSTVRLICSHPSRSPARRLSLDGAVAGGSVPLVAHISAAALVYPPSSDAIFAAFHDRHEQVLRYLIANPTTAVSRVLVNFQGRAARFGFLGLLNDAIALGIGAPESPSALLDDAISGGHIDVIEAIVANKALWRGAAPHASPAALDRAAGSGFTALLQRLLAPGFLAEVSISPAAPKLAALGGHYETFVWLWNLFPTLRPTSADMCDVALRGHVAVVDFYIKSTQRTLSLSRVLHAALIGGHSALAQIIVASRRASPTLSMFVDVARSGDLDSLAWLRSHVKVPVPQNALDAACHCAHLDMVVALVSVIGVPINAKVLVVAAESGSLAIVKYMITAAPAGDWARAMQAARSAGYSEILECIGAHIHRRSESTLAFAALTKRSSTNPSVKSRRSSFASTASSLEPSEPTPTTAPSSRQSRNE
nr:hypothetical protein HK105_003046 [Polyrhizophydium stewartii]